MSFHGRGKSAELRSAWTADPTLLLSLRRLFVPCPRAIPRRAILPSASLLASRFELGNFFVGCLLELRFEVRVGGVGRE
jgi:hypothetical protein